ncbi:TIGR02281 family clan AA aspartic protease [Rickettsiales bacterium]|nr:TIGR02281 family clan AA aspartic protease [Rickettsiales bacterium]|tara:strand:+ start:4866 stop:5468 length:603 start_codon:yes stop_codon:yes gene_type:complete
MQSNEWINILYLILLLAFIASSIFTRGNIPILRAIKYISIWAAIAIFVIILYSFRFDFIGLKNRFLGELNPSNIQVNSADKIIINMSYGNHFYANVKINNKNIRFLIDTGATDMVLSLRDARRVGIDLERLIFSKPYQTANGISYGASVILRDIKFGNLNLKNIPASVNNSDMGVSLLGMSFLRNFTKYEFYQDKLILTP